MTQTPPSPAPEQPTSEQPTCEQPTSEQSEGTPAAIEPPAVPTLRIARPGGELVVHDFTQVGVGPDAPLVLLVHGITANGLSWTATAAALAAAPATRGCRLWAPDLRGRAGSRGLPGPYGLDAHVEDLAAAADHAGVEKAVLVGHSMGGFVTALAGVATPDRVAAEVLVDGGPAFPAPEDLDVDAALQAVIGPAMTRLSMRFAGAPGYLDFWRQHPAVGPLLASPAEPAVTDYLLGDLVPAGDDSDEWVSSCVLAAIRADGRDVLSDARAHGGARAATERGVPVEFVWAQRGLLNEPTGLYDEQRIAALDLPAALRVTGVPDVNHYSVLFEPAGVDAIVAAVARVLTR